MPGRLELPSSGLLESPRSQPDFVNHSRLLGVRIQGAESLGVGIVSAPVVAQTAVVCPKHWTCHFSIQAADPVAPRKQESCSEPGAKCAGFPEGDVRIS